MSTVVVFEDGGWESFSPISLTRHISQHWVGTMPVIGYLSARFGDGVGLAGRRYLSEVVAEETGLEYNGPLDNEVLAVNARINPGVGLSAIPADKRSFVLLDRGGEVVAVRLSRELFSRAVARDGLVSQEKLLKGCKGTETLTSAEALLFAYPWEVVASNAEAITRNFPAKMRRTPSVVINPEAEVEEDVSLDTRYGPVIVEDGARVESFSRLSGPCFIGAQTVVHSALVRAGTTVANNCRVGGEVDNSIIYPYTNKAHFGFVGHSLIGSWVNLGAGSVTSDLKSTYGTVRVQRSGVRVDTGMIKLGAMVGDMAKVASGTVIHCGRVLGVSSHSSHIVDNDVPDFVHWEGEHEGAQFDLRLESVLETQSRMMQRRGMPMTEARRRLIRYLYARR